MIVSDVVVIAALGVFILVWWIRYASARNPVLLVAALVALGAGVYGVMDDRWQDGVGAAVAVVFLLALLIWKLRGSPRRGRLPFISGTLLALLAAIAIGAIYLFPITDLPRPAGPNAVGVKTFELVDGARLGVLHAQPDQPRRLLVRVWYPAGSVAGLQPRPYFDAREVANTARSMGTVFRFPLFFTYIKHAQTHSYENAPLLGGAAQLPTVIYSHGYTSFLSQNTALMEDLASHGYVVYSVQHTYDSAATVFPNGDVAPLDPAIIEDTIKAPAQAALPAAMIKGYTSSNFDDRLAGQLQHARNTLQAGERIVKSGPIWLADRLFVHDQLQRRAVPDNVADVVAASDLARVGEIGMSFGGSTTGAVCMVDPRCAAGVNLDGGDFHFLPFNADLPRPFLMFHSDVVNFYRGIGQPAAGSERLFNDFSYESFQNAGENADIHRLQLKGAAHLGLSDFTLFMRRPLRDALLGSAPTRVMLGTQNEFVRGFFDRYLRGIDNDFPKPQFAKYQGWVMPYDTKPVRQWWLAKPEQERARLQDEIDAVKRLASGG